MGSLSFRKFVEASDIFGFEREQRGEAPNDSWSTAPVDQFDVEAMMDLLAHKKVANQYGETTFPNVMQWGSQPGAVKLEVAPNYGFVIKKLGVDKQGNPRWVTKKYFQLNRTGFGGYEDSVAQEVFEHVHRAAEGMVEAPTEDFKDLDGLVDNIYRKLKRTAKNIFLPEGVKKLHDDAYILKFGVRGHGVEARDHNRIEQNQVLISFDRAQGTIRITDYNLLSRVGRSHEFKIGLNDADFYFFPTQSRDEIAEVVACKMRYY